MWGFSTIFSSWYSSRLDLNCPTYVRDIWNFRTCNFGTIFKLNCFILAHTSFVMSSLGPNIVDLQIHWCQDLTLFWLFLAYVKICRYIDPWCEECPLLQLFIMSTRGETMLKRKYYPHVNPLNLKITCEDGEHHFYATKL